MDFKRWLVMCMVQFIILYRINAGHINISERYLNNDRLIVFSNRVSHSAFEKYKFMSTVVQVNWKNTSLSLSHFPPPWQSSRNLSQIIYKSISLKQIITLGCFLQTILHSLIHFAFYAWISQWVNFQSGQWVNSYHCILFKYSILNSSFKQRMILLSLCYCMLLLNSFQE